MVVIEIAVFVSGAIIVLLTVLSAVHMVAIPRAEQVHLGRFVFIAVAMLFGGIARLMRREDTRDALWAEYAPIALLSMPFVWSVLVMLGFSGMYWALDIRPFTDALFLSGSSFTTLGFLSPDGSVGTLLSIAEAVLGLAVIALLLSFMPAHYTAFARREALVGRLEVRAGAPPSVVGMIERAHRIGWLDEMGETWSDWERWFIDLEESHTTYPALNFFRSPVPGQSWLASAGTVLDGAGFMLSSVRVEWRPEAALCIRAGYLALNRIGQLLGVAVVEGPTLADPISISRTQYFQMCDELATSGVPIVEDREQGWKDFVGWRVNYDVPLLAMVQLQERPTMLARPGRIDVTPLLYPTGY